MSNVTDNLNALRAAIAAAEKKYGREPGSVRLIAVSKQKPAADIALAWRAGQREFGENYLQEAVAKIRELADLDIVWHFIGALQSNKTRDVAMHFDWVHSVDRYKIAERLAKQRAEDAIPLNICLQINLHDEPTKAGIHPGQAALLAEQIHALPRIRLRGLMAIPEPVEDFDAQRRAFGELTALRDSLNAAGHDLDTLSMGMSGDMEAAIAAGATHIRIGTAIFGARG